MTITQIVIIIAGLIFGYRIVGYMLSPSRGEGDKKPRPSPDDQGSGFDKRSSANDHRERSYDSAWGGACPPAASGPAPAWHQTLGVTESASLDEIDRAYRVQISQYHPDKVTKLGEDIRQLAEARSKEINGAYDIARRLRRR